MQAHTIATRHYGDFDPFTGKHYELQDRMVRRACGSFVLLIAGDKPGDPDVEEAYSLEGVFEWLQELPWQIRRTVFICDAIKHAKPKRDKQRMRRVK